MQMKLSQKVYAPFITRSSSDDTAAFGCMCLLHLFCIGTSLAGCTGTANMLDLLDIGGKDDLYMLSFLPFVQRDDHEEWSVVRCQRS
jgi:hypothetical protein